MSATEPTTKNLADLYELPTVEWESVRRQLAEDVTQAPGTGGPNRHTFWLSTVDADGKPHVTGIGAQHHEGRFYFTGSPQSRKVRNVERDPRCALAVALDGADVTLEGRATRITDQTTLETLAEVFGRGGWAPTVADGGFVHEYSAPSAGPPPWYLYEMTVDDAYALVTEEPGGAARFTF
jgi:nitroimidazol reductase NimA-like FMN-containing flavoprotein (pyridoxamine 5'-phosphate oxidase superfamily)